MISFQLKQSDYIHGPLSALFLAPPISNEKNEFLTPISSPAKNHFKHSTCLFPTIRMRPDQKQLLSENRRIVIFDGVCNLCEYSVQFIVKHDVNARFKFVSAQSELGKELQLAYGIDTIKDGTVIFIKDKHPFIKSDAALEIARDLDGMWRFLYAFKYLPKTVRDYLYSVVSKYRYKWFGKKEECLLPDKRIKDRFLKE